MYLDGFITMPTFRPDGRLDALNKGGKENAEWLLNAAIASDEAKKAGRKKLDLDSSGNLKPPQSPRPPRPQQPQSILQPRLSRPAQGTATVGNRVTAKRKSLLGATTS